MISPELSWAIFSLIIVIGLDRLASTLERMAGYKFFQKRIQRITATERRFIESVTSDKILAEFKDLDTAFRNGELDEAKEEFSAAVQRIKGV